MIVCVGDLTRQGLEGAAHVPFFEAARWRRRYPGTVLAQPLKSIPPEAGVFDTCPHNRP